MSLTNDITGRHIDDFRIFKAAPDHFDVIPAGQVRKTACTSDGFRRRHTQTYGYGTLTTDLTQYKHPIILDIGNENKIAITHLDIS